MKRQQILSGNPSSSVHFERSLWEFSSLAYNRIEKEALSLQDEHDVNVNILLWCCWLHCEKLCLSEDCLDGALQSIEKTSDQTVTKLRAVRRGLQQCEGFTKEQVLSIKKHILNAEIMIERVLLQKLQDLTCRVLASAGDKASGAGVLGLEYYLDFAGIEDAAERAGAIVSLCRLVYVNGAGG